jgi:branched-subunit amino acid aminotransferase/4-amino-4-deoxychorismate lyase
MTKLTTILINGEASSGMVPVTDSSVLRGDGVFEVIKAYDGSLFRLADHLDRLERSAARLRVGLPPRENLEDWALRTAAEVGDGAVRIVVTRGSSVPGVAGEPLVIVFGHGWDRQDRPARLFPLIAPWHAAGHEWELAGAKITSYAPNMASTRRAVEEGFDDALLLTVDGLILEGPTFSVAWVVDGVVETPALDLGILDSITRGVVLELCEETGVLVSEVAAPLDRMRQASEVMAWSTVREVQPVGVVGDLEFEPGPVTHALYDAFAASTLREPGHVERR